MKRQTAALVIAFFSAIASFVVAGDFRSVMIEPASDSLSLDVPDAQFLTIRNFTQEGGAQRGVVTVTANGQTNNVLAAAFIDQGRSVPPEFIKKVVIPGPAELTVAPVPGTTLFVTYRRGLEPGTPIADAYSHAHSDSHANADGRALIFGLAEYLICFNACNVQISNLHAGIATVVQRACSSFDGLTARTGPKIEAIGSASDS